MMEAESDDALHGIVLGVDNLNDLVQDFLDIALHSAPVAPTDISGVVEDVRVAFEQDLRYREKCAVVSTLEDVPQIAVDANRVRQVIWNLVLNAAQATAETAPFGLRSSRGRRGGHRGG